MRRVGPALSAAELLRWTAVAGAGLLLLAALLLGMRRLAGALSQPLTLSALLLLAAVLVTAAVAIRLGQGVALRNPRARSAEPTGAIVSLAVVLLGLSVSLPGTSWIGLAMFWLVVAAEETWAWRHFWRPARSRVTSDPGHAAPIPSPHAPMQSTSVAPTIHGAVDVEPRSVDVELEESSEALAGYPAGSLEDEEPPADDVIQQLTRSRAADGSETLSGWLRVGLAAGQRNTNVHVAFCPSFARTPQVSVEQLDGPEARIKVVQVLPYGVRCDLKLAGVVDAPATVLLQLSAHAEPGARPATSNLEGTPAGDSA